MDYIYIWLLFLHLIADFVLQPRSMGTKKSEDYAYLALHIGIQYIIFVAGLSLFMDTGTAVIFSLSNALIHGVIDWNIWKLYKLSVWKRHRSDIESIGLEEFKKTWKYWEDYWFYLTIGVDQFLHGATIVGLYVYLG